MTAVLVPGARVVPLEGCDATVRYDPAQSLRCLIQAVEVWEIDGRRVPVCPFHHRLLTEETA